MALFLVSHDSTSNKPVSGELHQEKALRSVLYVPRRGTRERRVNSGYRRARA